MRENLRELAQNNKSPRNTNRRSAVRSASRVAGGGFGGFKRRSMPLSGAHRAVFANRGFELSSFPETREHTLGP